jgi:Lamin Tail Domain
MTRTAGNLKGWGILAVAASAAAAVTVVSCGPPPTDDVCKGRQVGDLVVTEIMADPDGTDTGNEYVELYNQLGSPVDLKGFTLYWKKPDGTGLKTHLIRAGTVPARGYFTLGDVRDGVLPAHIGYSYENDLGGLPQTDGVVGVRCKDLIFDEATYTATRPGRSRTFDGNRPPDATGNDDEMYWCDAPDLFSGMNYGSPAAPNPACPVTVAAGQCLEAGVPRPIVAPAAGDLVITEVMADPRLWSDADGEWIEVHSTANVDLNGLVFSSGASRSTLNSVDCLSMSTGGYAVFAGSPDAGIPALGTFSLSLTNGCTTPPGCSVSIGTSDAGLDTLFYATAVNGVSWQLDPAKLDGFSNDDPANLCRSVVPIFAGVDGGDLGTPGTANTACSPMSSNTCLDAVSGSPRPIVSPAVGDVVITEFMAGPNGVADALGEWFEVVVKSDVDLNGMVLKGSAATTTTLSSPNCVRPDAGTHLVFARSGDPALNGGLPPVAATFTFGMTDSAGSLTISNSDGGLLDTVSWATAQTVGFSTQLDVNKYDPVLNDTATNLCRTDAGTYGVFPDGGVNADRGTPGGINHVCL